MTIATANGRVGPGMYVFVSGLAGPVPIDDFLYVEVYSGSHPNIVCLGTALCNGLTSVLVIPGVFQVEFGHNAATFGASPGDSMTVAVTQFHANGVSVDNNAILGQLWDPHTGMWFLQSGAVGNGDLKRILDAVYRTFPSAT